MTVPTRTTKTFEERANENKRLKKVTPIYGNFQQNFKKRARELYKEEPKVRELYTGKRWFEDESIPTPEELFRRRPGFENDSTAKTIVRNLIQIPKEYYTWWAPYVQAWSYAETQQAKEEAIEAVDEALQRGLIDEEKSALIKQNISGADEYTVLDKKGIEKNLEEATGIPIQSGSRFGDLIGLAASIARFSRGSAGGRLARGVLGAGFSREVEENFNVSPGVSDFIGSVASQIPIPSIPSPASSPLAMAFEESFPSGARPPPSPPSIPPTGRSGTSGTGSTRAGTAGATRSWKDAIPPEFR